MKNNNWYCIHLAHTCSLAYRLTLFTFLKLLVFIMFNQSEYTKTQWTFELII